ncbi:MAG: acetate/propionate family kinase, partial [Pseudomonadota bacterium]
VFDSELAAQITGMVGEIGGASTLSVGSDHQPATAQTHEDAIALILDVLGRRGIKTHTLSAAGHRVVHGGAKLTEPVAITSRVLSRIEDCTPLAPLHNPHNLTAIRAIATAAPDLPQFASFDTSFHATNPQVATQYAIPDTPETAGIRRYGFHGLSYASLVRCLPEVTGDPLPDRLLAFHLGNGASLCAIKGGRSVATTMGYSPLDGLTMGTRCGGIDANAVLRLVELHGLDATKSLLNNESGLLGLSGGKSDMRRLMTDTTAASAFAVDHFCYWSVRHAGSLIAAMGGVDAIAFTGGIGENAVRVREQILTSLRWTGAVLNADANTGGHRRLHAKASAVAIYVIPAEEERQIAKDTLSLLAEEAA